MEKTAPVYNIFFNSVSNYVIMEWKGYATSSEFREGTELMLNTLIQNNSSKVLADTREMILIGQEDQQWLETNFLPRAMHFGFKKIAILRPVSYFNNVAIETINSKIDTNKLSLAFFDNLHEAENWLK